MYKDIEKFIKESDEYLVDCGSVGFDHTNEKLSLVIHFDWDKMYKSIHHYYEPQKITVDPYYSNPASEEFNWTFDRTMIEKAFWYNSETEERTEIDLSDEEKGKIISWIYKYKDSVVDDLDRDLYQEYCAKNYEEE